MPDVKTTRSICERLREKVRTTQRVCGLDDSYWTYEALVHPPRLQVEAATLIETQAALLEECSSLVRFFVEQGCPVCSGDCASANPMPSYCPMEDASHITHSIAKLKERRP